VINACSRAAASADCAQSDRQIHWPTHPHANAPVSLHSPQPRETPAPPTNSPAARVAPRFDPCTPVHIEPLPDVRAPKGSDPIRATTSLTRGDVFRHRPTPRMPRHDSAAGSAGPGATRSGPTACGCGRAPMRTADDPFRARPV
jgi:hypothetical protein